MAGHDHFPHLVVGAAQVAAHAHLLLVVLVVAVALQRPGVVRQGATSMAPTEGPKEAGVAGHCAWAQHLSQAVQGPLSPC